MKNKKRCIILDFGECKNATAGEDFLDLRNMKTCILSQIPTAGNASNICTHFSEHGWCERGVSCQFTHNVDTILDYHSVKHLISAESEVKKKKYLDTLHLLRKLNDQGPSDTSSESPVQSSSSGTTNALPDAHSNTVVNESNEQSNAHHSGYDAFMTGYCFATFINDLTINNQQIVNRVYISGHKNPFWIHNSSYTKVSSNFQKKLQGLFHSTDKSQ